MLKNLPWRGKNIRLQVFLSHAGVASRRACEEIISQGRVSVNGAVVTLQGTKVNQESDIVLLDGKPVMIENRLVYLALNKPPGYICASNDPQGRALALSLLPSTEERLYNVGRLDFLSCGLIFFTNDGNFANRLGHPKSAPEKEYFVEAAGQIPDEAIDAFNAGITIEGARYRAKTAERLSRKTMRIILIEGKNREIRRVFSHFRLHPRLLRRIRIGSVLLGDLAEGSSRPLEKRELRSFEKKLTTEDTKSHGVFLGLL
ncbi:MAG: rRNA pseudouridine synthase [Treponema sp.]|jgi:23S rRNA pseudouridine2605 synthase|nr:rRNA pseudouridine synthase [Treponema sp.]